MRAALIPSAGAESTALMSDMHLMLPMMECMSNDAYVRAYMTAGIRGHYIILDNGAAEGQLVPTQMLLQLANTFEVQEIVAPDTLDDQVMTFNQVRAFFDHADLNDLDLSKYKIQAVLQGRTMYERSMLLDYYATREEIQVIGIPKVAIRHSTDDVRLEIAEMIFSLYPDRFEMHLLGASPYFPDELAIVDFPTFIRSTDSALPYKMSGAGLPMQTGMQHVERWKNYFSDPVPMEEDLLYNNIRTYISWAKRNES